MVPSAISGATFRGLSWDYLGTLAGHCGPPWSSSWALLDFKWGPKLTQIWSQISSGLRFNFGCLLMPCCISGPKAEQISGQHLDRCLDQILVCSFHRKLVQNSKFAALQRARFRSGSDFALRKTSQVFISRVTPQHSLGRAKPKTPWLPVRGFTHLK